MAHQPEAVLEKNLIARLSSNGYSRVIDVFGARSIFFMFIVLITEDL